MFGLFKPKPAPTGPVTFEFEIDIACPAGELYRIIDFGDDKCWKREVGTVERLGPNAFCMRLDVVEGIDFLLTVFEGVPGERYAYNCLMEPRVGRLLKCTESYELTPAGETSCLAKITAVAEFEPGMTRKDWQEEVKMMALAVNNSLAKLKIHAEQGVEKIREIEEIQKVA